MADHESTIVPLGGVWEGSSWEVRFNIQTSAYFSKQYEDWSDEACHHAFDRTEDEGVREWKIPRVVVMYNEAGHSSTGVCMDCVVEWATANE